MLELEVVKLRTYYLARPKGVVGNCGSNWQAGRGNTPSKAIASYYRNNK